jgi:hypothetical protein
MSKAFLRISFTDSYAASKKLPIITGCFFERRLADNNIQGIVTK